MSTGAKRSMYVADLDMSQDVPSTSERTAMAPMSVPSNDAMPRTPPRAAAAPNYQVQLARAPASELQLQKDNRALKEDLLKAKAELSLQAHEVQELRTKLGDRERSLQLTKSELLQTRITLKEKEGLLQEAYERLRRATQERSEYRRYLADAERELQTTRSELLEWSHGLHELKSVMEGLDDRVGDVMGTSYASVMAEIEHSLDDLRSEHSPPNVLESLKFDESMTAEDVEAITEALKGLQELSQEILNEAKEDAVYFS